MAKRVLLCGAGAIGRGFLAPRLAADGYGIDFVETNAELRAQLRACGRYRAAITAGDHYDFVDVPVGQCFAPGDEIPAAAYDLVFSAVGPGRCYDLAGIFRGARAVISCENDRASAPRLRELSGNPRIWFGIPDVITSNTAPRELLTDDPLTTVTEQGILVAERGADNMPACIEALPSEQLEMHWRCKLFIHNAPHALTAYLGWLHGCEFIHQAMAVPVISDTVTAAIAAITEGLVRAGMAERGFAEAYQDKELDRFRNRLLFDPISRVAREPLRKLARDDRLVLALRLCTFYGLDAESLATGICAALAYDHPDDEGAQHMQRLRRSGGDRELLRTYCGIEPYDPLCGFILARDLAPYRR